MKRYRLIRTTNNGCPRSEWRSLRGAPAALMTAALRDGESGRASSWLFLLAASLLVPYLYIGESGLLKWMTAEEARVAVMVGTAVFAFAFAAAVRFLIIERMGGTGLQRQLRNDIRELRALISSNASIVDSIENELRSRSTRSALQQISPHGAMCIEVAKRVIHSIRVRVIDAEQLLSSGNRYSQEDASDLLRGQPVVTEGLNKISIGGAMAPFVPPVGWLRVMPLLIEEIGRSIRRAA